MSRTVSTIDYKALAERIEKELRRLEKAQPFVPTDLTQHIADLRTVASLLNGMAEAEPFRYAYRYPDGYIRFTNGEHINGVAPDEAIRVYLHPAPQPQPTVKESLPVEPTEAQVEEYEILCNDEWVAGASGPGAEAEILHYLTQYEQDGPCEVYAVTRRLVDRAAFAAKEPDATP